MAVAVAADDCVGDGEGACAVTAVTVAFASGAGEGVGDGSDVGVGIGGAVAVAVALGSGVSAASCGGVAEGAAPPQDAAKAVSSRQVPHRSTAARLPSLTGMQTTL